MSSIVQAFYNVIGKGNSYTKQEQQKNPSLVEKLQQTTAFKFLVKTDLLDERRRNQKTGIENLYTMYAEALTIDDKSKLVKGVQLIVGEMQAIYFDTTSPWARSREGEFFRDLYSLFIRRCEAYGDIPKIIPQLFTNALHVMNTAYTNLDVEPQTPIVLFAPQQGQSGAFDINKALDFMNTGGQAKQ